MRTRTATPRTLLAAATLAALPLATGTLPMAPVHAPADAAGARNVTERRNGPEWSFILNERDRGRTGCWLLSGWAEIWCRVYGL